MVAFSEYYQQLDKVDGFMEQYRDWKDHKEAEYWADEYINIERRIREKEGDLYKELFNKYKDLMYYRNNMCLILDTLSYENYDHKDIVKCLKEAGVYRFGIPSIVLMGGNKNGYTLADVDRAYETVKDIKSMGYKHKGTIKSHTGYTPNKIDIELFEL